MRNNKHISDSAFLVNESRARNAGLSRDRYAELWVSEATRQLWEDFSREVYPFDAIELSLRNRFYLDVLETSIRKHVDTVFVNFAAGFASYPFLTEKPCRSIEVDFAHVCEYKRRKIDVWRKEGAMPEREVEFIACDLQSESDLGRLAARLRSALSNTTSVAFLEGITYYLPRKGLLRLFDMLRDLQRPGSVIALDFWTPDVATHPVHVRFRKFFADRFGLSESDYNLFDIEFLKSIRGYEPSETTDVVELEKRFSADRKLLRPNEILPEHYAVLRRLAERK
jgi:O-methyltransferase involved in polyketide biosynthesis